MPATPDITQIGTGDTLVVCAHGVLDRGRSFTAVAASLADECTVGLYDRRGYGASLDPAAEPPDLDRHIDDLLTVLDGRRGVVVGHSFGGVIAFGAAVRAPELVAAVVVYETVLAWAPGWDDSVMRKMLAEPDPEGAGLGLMMGDRVHALASDRLRRLRREASTFVAEERAVRADGPPYDLAGLRAPVVYAHGDAWLTLTPVVDLIRAHAPALELVTVDGADHHAHRTRPDAFADAVRRGVTLAHRHDTQV